MRPIDADTLKNKFGACMFKGDTIRSIINEQCTMDVIPKAEVRKLLRDNAEKVSDSILDIVKEEYIQKADYEKRLKADLVAMLEDLDLEIDESAAYNLEVAKVQRLIRDRIDKLSEDK